MRDVGESQASNCMYRVSYKQPARPRASVFEDVVERVDHCHPVTRAAAGSAICGRTYSRVFGQRWMHCVGLISVI